MDLLSIETENILDSLNKVTQSDPRFQRKALGLLKKDIISHLDQTTLSASTKCYLLHQVSQVHSAQELRELFNQTIPF